MDTSVASANQTFEPMKCVPPIETICSLLLSEVPKGGHLARFFEESYMDPFIHSNRIGINREQIADLIRSALLRPGAMESKKFVSEYSQKHMPAVVRLIAKQFCVTAEWVSATKMLRVQAKS